jgi:hypothetical protein
MKRTNEGRSPGVWRRGCTPASRNRRQASRTFRGSRRQADVELSNFPTEVVKGQMPGLTSCQSPPWKAQGPADPPALSSAGLSSATKSSSLFRRRIDELAA